MASLTERPGDTVVETPVAAYLRELHGRLAGVLDGEVASYIPELAHADPKSFGIAMATADGHVYTVGDTNLVFTIQSVSKPLVFGMALDDRGLDPVLERVGVEASGDAFNSIVLDEVSRRPYNPMVNAGAILTSGLVAGRDRDAQLARILDGLARFIGHQVDWDPSVFSSERATGHRNRAIAHLMRGFDMIDGDVEGVLDLYFRQCSVNVTCRDLAIMAATLANRGVNPVTGARALEERHVANVLSVMSTCGMYDYAGEWVYRIGMPAKSGVSGGILAVLPGQFGIGVFSPPLDARGNSVRGIAVCSALSRAFQLHLLQTHSSIRSAVRRSYGVNKVASKKFRGPAETTWLEEKGHRVRVYELQGDLYFGSLDALARLVANDLATTETVLLDCKRIGTVDAAAANLLVGLSRMIIASGASVALTNLDSGSVARQAFAATPDGENGDDHVLFFHDIDAALEWSEDNLLRGSGAFFESPPLVALADQELLEGLDESDISLLEAETRTRRFEPGAIIFEEGHEADALYFLAGGTVEILVRIGGQDGRHQRLATIAPGVAFGEMAALDGQRRSTTVRAQDAVVCQVLGVTALTRLTTDHPRLAVAFHRNVSRSLSRRVRRLTAEVRSHSE